MYVSTIMNLFYRGKHFNYKLYSNLQAVVSFQNFPDFCEIRSKKIHYDQILFRILYKIIDITYMFETFELRQNIIFKYQNTFIFIFLLNFQCNLFEKFIIIRLVNQAESALSKFMFDIKSLWNPKRLFSWIILSCIICWLSSYLRGDVASLHI